MALALTTEAATDIVHNSATGNGTVTDDNGGDFTRRGFVLSPTSHGDPGNVAPEDSDYESVYTEGTDNFPFHVQRGETNMAAGTTTVTIDLTTPVPNGKSFAIVSMRANAYQPSRTLATATLMTDSGGNWTQLRIQRAFATDTAADYQWEVVWGNGFTVQTGEATLPTSGTKQLDVTITAVDLSKAFALVSMRTNNTGAIAGFIRGKLTSTTNLQLNAGDTATSSYSGIVRWYVVEWEGATVQSGSTAFNTNNSTRNETISTVDRTKSFVVYSWDMLAFSTNVGIIATRAALTSDTNLQFFRALNSASANGTVDWFVVSHPDISVQYGQETLTAAASANPSITSVSDAARTFMPTPLQGNASCNTNANLTLHDGYNTRYLSDVDDITLERGTSNNNLISSWFVVADAVVTYAEEAYTKTLSGLSPETQYYYRAFMRSSGQYAYGDEETFTTDSAPVIGTRGSAVPVLAAI